MLHRRLNRIELMARWFDGDKGLYQMAAFFGVSYATVLNWTKGKAKPTRAAARLLAVMERIEGTEIHEALVAQARAAAPPSPPRVVKPKPVRKTGW